MLIRAYACTWHVINQYGAAKEKEEVQSQGDNESMCEAVTVSDTGTPPPHLLAFTVLPTRYPLPLIVVSGQLFGSLQEISIARQHGERWSSPWLL